MGVVSKVKSASPAATLSPCVRSKGRSVPENGAVIFSVTGATMVALAVVSCASAHETSSRERARRSERALSFMARFLSIH